MDMPEDLPDEVAGAYAALGEPPVAVRSSAIGEDSAEATFAGQQETFLWVRGVEQVCEAVRDCWISLYSATARLATAPGWDVIARRRWESPSRIFFLASTSHIPAEESCCFANQARQCAASFTISSGSSSTIPFWRIDGSIRNATEFRGSGANTRAGQAHCSRSIFRHSPSRPSRKDVSARPSLISPISSPSYSMTRVWPPLLNSQSRSTRNSTSAYCELSSA